MVWCLPLLFYLCGMMQDIMKEAGVLSWVDWAATITALFYIVLAAREKVWCWFWGIISCSLWAYASYAFYELYLDAILQVFYVVMGFVGIYNWRYGGEGSTKAPFCAYPGRSICHIWQAGLCSRLLLVTSLISIPLPQRHTGTPLPRCFRYLPLYCSFSVTSTIGHIGW